MRIVHNWLVNIIIALSVSLHLPYMVKHKVLLDKRRSHSWTLLLVMGSFIYTHLIVKYHVVSSEIEHVCPSPTRFGVYCAVDVLGISHSTLCGT